ncbi:helix-turn-helix domain-containing protein [Streptomyces sp. NPDC093094]|uniref:helix-turn-helix domain-containing protein n=1 Tax=Streptomyces sp. NPDC093094 TaxID=3366026 RepID=UPI0038066035
MEAMDTTAALAGPKPISRPGQYVRVKAVAEYFDVAVSTIYQAIEAGDLPAIAIGRGYKKALRVHEDDFRAFEVRCRVQPTTATTA